MAMEWTTLTLPPDEVQEIRAKLIQSAKQSTWEVRLYRYTYYTEVNVWAPGKQYKLTLILPIDVPEDAVESMAETIVNIYEARKTHQ